MSNRKYPSGFAKIQKKRRLESLTQSRKGDIKKYFGNNQLNLNERAVPETETNTQLEVEETISNEMPTNNVIPQTGVNTQIENMISNDLETDNIISQTEINTQVENDISNEQNPKDEQFNYDPGQWKQIDKYRDILVEKGPIASAERSFSKLKILKNYLRSTMSQERLNDLAILSIEHELLSLVDYQTLIDDFASKKARTKLF